MRSPRRRAPARECSGDRGHSPRQVSKERSSWDFFSRLLNEAHVVGTPGSGFGPSGEGYVRLTAFGQRDQTVEAVERIKTRLAL